MSATIKTFIEKYLLTDPDFKYYYTYLQSNPLNRKPIDSSIVRYFDGDSFLQYLMECNYVYEIYNLCKDSIDQSEKASETVKLITSKMYLIIVIEMFFNKVKEVTVDQDMWELSVEAFDPAALFAQDDWLYIVSAKNKANKSWLVSNLRLYIYFTPDTFYMPQYITISSQMNQAAKKYSFKLDSPTVFIERIKWLIGDNK